MDWCCVYNQTIKDRANTASTTVIQCCLNSIYVDHSSLRTSELSFGTQTSPGYRVAHMCSQLWFIMAKIYPTKVFSAAIHQPRPPLFHRSFPQFTHSHIPCQQCKLPLPGSLGQLTQTQHFAGKLLSH